MTRVAGVDGCKAGWLAVSLDLTSGRLVHGVYADASALFAGLAYDAVVAIDIPVGLPASGARACDRAVRRLLGRPRGSSVFPAPIRPALTASSRVDADRLTRAVDGRGVGAQAWNLYARIREVDACLQGNPALRGRVCESHPELCFWAMNGESAPPDSKHTAAGLGQRRVLVERAFAGGAFESVRAAYRRGRVADDDILDAFAVCWSAARAARRDAVSLPDPAPLDDLGLPMRILY